MKKPFKYWTKDNCRLEALKYSTRSEFQLNSSGAYYACLRNKWEDDLFSHMIRIGNRYLKCVYAYEFSDNYTYIGITYNMKRRIHDRNKCITDSVTLHIKETGLTPILNQLTNYINVEEAIVLEEKYLQEYKNNGWYILNKVKTGSIGSVKKWSKEKCKETALRFENKTDFRKNFNGAYQCALINGWLNEICSHMTIKIKPPNYWTKERCKEEFLKCKTKKEVKLNSITAYSVALKNDWINDFSKHMTTGRKPNGYWNIENCLREAMKYSKRTDFQKNSGSAYNIAFKNNWLENIYLNANL